MGRVRPPYPAEFKRQMVELVRAGRTPEELVNWSHGDCAFASRQSQVDDLLISHRLNDANLRAQRAFSARVVSDDFQMMGANAKEHSIACPRLARRRDREIGSTERAHAASSRARERALEEVHRGAADEIWPAHALRREIPSVTHHFCGDPAS